MGGHFGSNFCGRRPLFTISSHDGIAVQLWEECTWTRGLPLSSGMAMNSFMSREPEWSESSLANLARMVKVMAEVVEAVVDGRRASYLLPRRLTSSGVKVEGARADCSAPMVAGDI